MKKILLGLMVATLLISGCGTGTPAATPTPIEAKELPLEPFTDEHFGIEGLRPEGWAEIQPGTFVEEASPPYVPQFLYAAYEGLTMEWAEAYFARELGLESIPESTSTYESASLTWEFTAFEVDHPEMGKVMVDGALAETNSALYVVAVLANGDEYEALHEAVLLPAVEALAPVEVEQRERLTQAELMGDARPQEGPVNNTYFTPIGVAGPPLHQMEGLLSVPQFQLNASESGAGNQARFPRFSVEFFTYEDYLVPTQREIVPPAAEDNLWSIVLSPGKVWSEAADGGMSRASFPFLLVAQQSNEAHNGVATFLYDDERVSSLYVQVAQETAAWNQRDFWGQSPMEYTPGVIDNADDLQAAFARGHTRPAGHQRCR